MLRIVDEVEEEVFKTQDREVPTGVIGREVTERLRRVDEIAYVRFASVYKGFDDRAASWSEGRITDQECGQIWLDTFGKINRHAHRPELFYQPGVALAPRFQQAEKPFAK